MTAAGACTARAGHGAAAWRRRWCWFGHWFALWRQLCLQFVYLFVQSLVCRAPRSSIVALSYQFGELALQVLAFLSRSAVAGRCRPIPVALASDR